MLVAAGGLLAATALQAADLPSRNGSVLAPVAPVFTWTGFYVGAHAGYGFGDDNSHRLAPGGSPASIANATIGFAIGSIPSRINQNNKGLIGGGQIGYNYQIGSVVLGAEADLSYSDVSSKAIVETPEDDLRFAGVHRASSSLDWLGTARLRLGFAVDRFLIFATGGVAFGNVNHSASVSYRGVGRSLAGSTSSFETGWTVGGGVEYAFTNNVSVKAEYLYYDLGRKNYFLRAVSGFTPDQVLSAKGEMSGNVVRAGVNYRF
ncbi:porin family protein [Boseaceae bacterium BT-24-1]|nr:porin family protein [Boseaceae bacterium BT-24-1]